eukprot:931785-Pelagomonas_calceolata.AAC.2
MISSDNADLFAAHSRLIDNSIRTAEGESRSRRKLTRQEVKCNRWSSLPMSVNQACSPRALAKSFCNHSASNIMTYSFHVGNDMILAAWELVECAI